MDVKNIEFKVKHNGAMVPVNLSFFQPKHMPLMYRLLVNIGKHGKVIILYPQNEERTQFKYYRNHDKEVDLMTEKLITKIKTLKV